MSSNVTSLQEERLKRGAHVHGMMRCMNPECRHEQVAVMPVDADEPAECQRCGLMRSMWIWPFEPEDGTSRYACRCTSQHFMVLMDGVMCIGCGRTTTFQELAEIMS